MMHAQKLDPRETHVRIPSPHPGLHLRGAWDSKCTDADAAWLLNAMPASRDLKIPRATHLMHLEENRYHLYRATEAFLTARED